MGGAEQTMTQNPSQSLRAGTANARGGWRLMMVLATSEVPAAIGNSTPPPDAQR